jgi:endogenous inhibitor of DNA gyrase (YacG/DUF329 family)
MPEAQLCVSCRERPVVARYAPFCSDRCKMTDLGRWLSGDYRVAAGPEADDPERDRPTTDDGQDEHP